MNFAPPAPNTFLSVENILSQIVPFDEAIRPNLRH